MSFKPSTPRVSFEFFPPASPEMAYKLWGSAMALGPLSPSFVSVTYGAGGSTRRRTIDAIKALRANAKMAVAGHLTCVGATKEETLAVAREYRAAGVSRIVALRGDPPKREDGSLGAFEPHEGGFRDSIDLIAALDQEVGLPIAVGAYPEKHPEAADAADDIAHLKRKLDAGADVAITQFFFDNEDFLRFRDRAAAAGVDKPILPGMLPIERFERMVKFAAGCGANVPQRLHELYAAAETPEAAKALSLSLCVAQCRDLLERGGVEHLHFYTLNTPDLTFETCRALGIEPRAEDLAAAG
ncbi:MAG: methylenetetrahydrofolate reductase [Pseudomonadota bacterium]